MCRDSKIMLPLLFKGDKKEEAMQLFTAILRNGLAHSV
jgi:hypothetical protein